MIIPSDFLANLYSFTSGLLKASGDTSNFVNPFYAIFAILGLLPENVILLTLWHKG